MYKTFLFLNAFFYQNRIVGNDFLDCKLNLRNCRRKTEHTVQKTNVFLGRVIFFEIWQNYPIESKLCLVPLNLAGYLAFLSQGFDVLIAIQWIV